VTANGSGAPHLPKIFIHIGEPKTGTTFLQQLMFSNRRALVAQGVILPGVRPRYHFRATQDLRGVVPEPNDPLAPFEGAWDRLVQEVLQAPRVGLVTHEMLSSVTQEQADRAVQSFGDAEVHVVLSVRDFGSLLPAEWQESIKNRNTESYEQWLGHVIDSESIDPDRRQWWFWKVHDTLEILRMWSRHVPPERVHVITMPPRGSSQNLLWERFANLVGIDPDSVDPSRAKSNASLSVAEVEFIRRINLAMPPDMPEWFYMHHVKGALAHNAFAGNPKRGGRLSLPAERDEWATKQAESVIADIRASGYDVIGDLDELLPRPPEGTRFTPQDATSEDMVEAGVLAILRVLHEFQESLTTRPAAPAAARPSGRRAKVKRAVLRASDRHDSVYAARRAWWWMANTGRALRAKLRSR
jgi:hypothetical protein